MAPTTRAPLPRLKLLKTQNVSTLLTNRSDGSSSSVFSTLHRNTTKGVPNVIPDWLSKPETEGLKVSSDWVRHELDLWE